jgi:glutathione S-transferase
MHEAIDDRVVLAKIPRLALERQSRRSPAMLTVHHLGVSQSERIVWLCEELGISYELKRYDRDPQVRGAPPEYKALHPLGAAPVITDGDVVMAESGAIVDYIIARYGDGRLSVKPDAANYPDYIYWLHYVNGTFQPAAMVNMILAHADLPSDHLLLHTMAARYTRSVEAIEARLGQAHFLAGDQLTAADIMMVFSLTTMRYFNPFNLSSYPNILAYLQRIGERPAYILALTKADPGMVPLLA